jgi:hypothetical protein
MSDEEYNLRLDLSRIPTWLEDMLERSSKSFDELVEIYFCTYDNISPEFIKFIADELRPLIGNVPQKESNYIWQKKIHNASYLSGFLKALNKENNS